MNILPIVLMSLATTLFAISLIKSKEKTKKGLKMSGTLIRSVALDIFSILALVALILNLIPPDTIKVVLGGSSVATSTLIAASFGTVTLIPSFIAFPLAASLVQGGAHLVSMAAFITTLTMVGFITAPVEIKFFGKKFTLIRNLLSFIAAIIIALSMGAIL